METRKRSTITPSPPNQSRSRKFARKTISDLQVIARSISSTIEEKTTATVKALFHRMEAGVWFKIFKNDDELDNIYDAIGILKEDMHILLKFIGLFGEIYKLTNQNGRYFVTMLISASFPPMIL